MVALLAVLIALIILRLSKRNPVNSLNVNDQSDVKINAGTATHAQATA